MSPSQNKKPQSPPPEPLALATVSRAPQQGRSKASFERMLATARELMLERRGEDFTLQDVSQRGNVSIGSIYLRFKSKDNLVRAVIANALEELGVRQTAMIGEVCGSATTLAEFVPRYVESYAEVLREHAPLLRLAMERAASDPLVSGPGKQSADRSARLGLEAMLTFADEFGGSDPEVKASASYHIIFATLARELSLGSTGESARGYDWEQLKRELARMCLAYLKAD
ncbi:MAG: TetR/AcrR family transcriptional regulator [Novosphingobium sp.]